MNSNELGEKGESRFKEICADASLICNKSDRDLTGWDFIVEFQFEDQPSVSLDHRKSPLSCHIQQKTILNTSKTVSMRLNMAERLAKELKPAFICVFKVNANNDFTDAYLIHISNNRLGAILKRLRTEQAKSNRKPINKLDISFTPTVKEKITLSGASLKKALMDYCGSDLHKYANDKQTQLKQLGYEGNPFEGKFSISITDPNQLADFFLGLSREIPVSNFEANEKRFGIPLPLTDFVSGDAKISVNPAPFDTCSIVVSGKTLDSPSVFDGELFRTPLFIDSQQIYVKSDLFSIRMTDTNGGLIYEFSFNIQGKKATPMYWEMFWRMMQAFKENSGTIEIKPKNNRTAEFSIPDNINIDLQNWPDLEAAISVSGGLSRILKIAGIQPEPSFLFDDIFCELYRIGTLIAFISGTQPALNDSNQRVILGQYIFASRIKIGELVIAYYATALIENDHGNFSIRDFKLIKVRKLKDAELATYQSFIEAAKLTEGIELVQNFYTIMH